MKKTFILDTNVILNDYDCLIGFSDNNIVIPTIVLEELDNIKKRTNVIGQNARVFIRKLEKIMESLTYDEIKNGISLGENRGLLYVLRTDALSNKDIFKNFNEKTPDNILLAITQHLMNSKEFKNIILVTMDINLRVKARSIGLTAEDYQNSKIENVNTLYNSILDANADGDLIKKLHTDGKISKDEYNKDKEILNNQYLILKNGSGSALCYYNAKTNELVKIEKEIAYGITPKNAEQVFAMNALMRDDINLVAFEGISGAGKTLLSIASAIEQKSKFKQIYISKSTVFLNNSDSLGYLPGSLDDKMSYFLKPFMDNLDFIKSNFKETSKAYQKIEDMLKNKKIVIEPLQYIRGRSLNNIIFLLDEAQNLEINEIKTILTRAGENIKFVFMGDAQQIDTPTLSIDNNGLTHLINTFKGYESFAHVNFTKGERSKLADFAWKNL